MMVVRFFDKVDQLKGFDHIMPLGCIGINVGKEKHHRNLKASVRRAKSQVSCIENCGES